MILSPSPSLSFFLSLFSLSLSPHTFRRGGVSIQHDHPCSMGGDVQCAKRRGSLRLLRRLHWIRHRRWVDVRVCVCFVCERVWVFMCVLLLNLEASKNLLAGLQDNGAVLQDAVDWKVYADGDGAKVCACVYACVVFVRVRVCVCVCSLVSTRFLSHTLTPYSHTHNPHQVAVWSNSTYSVSYFSVQELASFNRRICTDAGCVDQKVRVCGWVCEVDMCVCMCVRVCL